MFKRVLKSNCNDNCNTYVLLTTKKKGPKQIIVMTTLAPQIWSENINISYQWFSVFIN